MSNDNDNDDDNNFEELTNSLGFSEFKQSAVSMHEMFTNFVEAGFTRAEALQMICSIISASLSGTTSSD